MTLAVVILCNCPLIEGIQNQSSSLQVLIYNFFTHDLKWRVILQVSVSHSESILALLPGSFPLKSLEVV